MLFGNCRNQQTITTIRNYKEKMMMMMMMMIKQPYVNC